MAENLRDLYRHYVKTIELVIVIPRTSSSDSNLIKISSSLGIFFQRNCQFGGVVADRMAPPGKEDAAPREDGSAAAQTKKAAAQRQFQATSRGMAPPGRKSRAGWRRQAEKAASALPVPPHSKGQTLSLQVSGLLVLLLFVFLMTGGTKSYQSSVKLGLCSYAGLFIKQLVL